MKKGSVALLTALIAGLALVVCFICFNGAQAPLDAKAKSENFETVPVSRPESADAPDVAKDAAPQSRELVGPWHLDGERNDLAAFAASLKLFPGYGEWGAGMEIRSNGQMSWYIGAESWYGTYTVDGGTLHAQLTSNLEQLVRPWDFRMTTDKNKLTLEMPYDDRTICWVYGDQADSAGGNEP